MCVLPSLAIGPALADEKAAGPAPPPGNRDDAAKTLRQAESLRAGQLLRQQDAAKVLLAARQEASRLAEQRVAEEAALRTIEHDVLHATAELGRAQATEQAAEAELQDRAAAFSALIPLMLRMSRYPAETVLAVPAPPDRAVEGLLLTRGLAVSLARQAADLRAQAGQAAQAKAATQARAAELAKLLARQHASEDALDKRMAQARSDMSAAEAEGRRAAQQVASLAAQAQTLKNAIAAMDQARAAAVASAARAAREAEKKRQPAEAASAHAREASLARPAPKGGLGRMVMPAAGAVLKKFGAPEADGTATGITIGTAPNAFVASPCAGRVAFAAPFRSYGQLVIVECGGAYDVVLAGLGKIDTAPGRGVRAGEPIGRMPANTPSAAGEPARRADLYVELRAHGDPVDPAPFLN